MFLECIEALLSRFQVSLGKSAFDPILRKEVIQPQVPLRLPCYDFTPVADLTVDDKNRLQVKPTPMV